MPDSLAVQRNKAFRAALTARWPDVAFAVRNSRRGWARVAWTDGPTPQAVREVIDANARTTDGRTWGKDLEREVTSALIAAAYLRQHQGGDRTYFAERDSETGATFPPQAPPLTGSALASWKNVWEDFDASSMTPAERRCAMLICELAGTPKDASESSRARVIARAVAHHGDVVLATFS